MPCWVWLALVMHLCFRPIADGEAKLHNLCMMRIAAIALTVYGIACGACSISKTSDKEVAETGGPQYAILCVPTSAWPLLLSKMRQFATTRRLEFHGGIDTAAPNGRPQINAYVADGYSYFFGDEFDLWFVSDPFRSNVIYLNGVVKRKPVTPEQNRLAEALLSDIQSISLAARGPSSDPDCS